MSNTTYNYVFSSIYTDNSCINPNYAYSAFVTLANCASMLEIGCHAGQNITLCSSYSPSAYSQLPYTPPNYPSGLYMIVDNFNGVSDCASSNYANLSNSLYYPVNKCVSMNSSSSIFTTNSSFITYSQYNSPGCSAAMTQTYIPVSSIGKCFNGSMYRYGNFTGGVFTNQTIAASNNAYSTGISLFSTIVPLVIAFVIFYK